MAPNTQLQFVESTAPAGAGNGTGTSAGGSGSIGVGGEAGNLLAVDGETTGWSVCPSETGQKVLWWKGEGEGCQETFLQVVGEAPYLRRM